MSPKDRLSAFGEEAGFGVELESDVVRAVKVPCLLENGVLGTCTIEKSYDPGSEKPTERTGGAIHAVRILTDTEGDGRVYHVDGTPIGTWLKGDGRTWSNISIRKGSQASPEEDGSARDLIHRYAKQIVGAVAAAGYSETAFLGRSGPFKIPNTFEARAVIGPGSGPYPRSADCRYWSGWDGRLRPRPCCQNPRDGNPSSRS